MNKHELQIGEIVESLKGKIEKFHIGVLDDIKKYRDDLQSILKILTQIEESWSGSWIGFHADLYYEGFERPPWNKKFDSEWGSIHGIPGYWQEKTYKDIASFVNGKYKGAQLDKIGSHLSQILEKVKDLQSKICSDISFIRNFNKFDKEIKMLDKIEKLKWGISPNELIEAIRPKQLMTRDSYALYQGSKVPPHIQYKSKAMYFFSAISSIEDFINSTKRLLRQVEVRVSIKKEGHITMGVVEKIKLLCKKFHAVDRTLRQRYNKRNTLEIEDEYDVQDLTHALLKIFFNDVRPEEWTPSYAGSSSRMDFLLKEHKTVIEVKKTRKNLKDKEIGEQLLVDIGRYRNHPDCETLICFIYDPEGRLNNPQGLKTDLAQLSDEQLNVVVFIESS